MINPQRGEVGLTVGGEERVLRLTLGSLAALEAKLEARSLMDLVEGFENGRFKASDLLLLIWAGLNGGGAAMTCEEVGQLDIDGGPIAAARVAGRLLAATFSGQK